MHYTSFVYLPRFSSTPPESFKTGTVPVESIGPEHSLHRPLLPASFLVSFLETFVFILYPPLDRLSFASLGVSDAAAFYRFLVSSRGRYFTRTNRICPKIVRVSFSDREPTPEKLIRARTIYFFVTDWTETRNFVSGEIIYRLYNILFFWETSVKKEEARESASIDPKA